MNNTDTLLQLPSGWIYAQLGDLIEPSKEKINPVATDSSYYIGLEHIEKYTGKILSYGKSEEVTSTKSVFHDGDLLYGKLRPYLNKVCTPDFNGVCSTDILVFTRQADLSNKYLKYRMLCPDFVRFANQNATGVNHPRIDFKKISTFVLALPPLAEQHRIVAKIEELFTKLDAGVESLKKAKAQLNQYRQAVLFSAISGELTKEWRSMNRSNESSAQLLDRIISERKKKSINKELIKPDTSGLHQIPSDWMWVRLDTIAELKGGITKDQKRNVVGGRMIPYLRVANVQRGFIDLVELKEIETSDEEISALRLMPNDILFNEGGDRDKLGRGWIWQGELPECIHQNHVFRARLYIQDISSSKFVSHCGNTYGIKYFIKEGKQTTNLASINLTKLSAFPIPLPPIDEQRVIVSEIEGRLTIIDDIEKAIDVNLSRAETLRQSILAQAFSGKLVPQDPNDEPAEKLLERIRAERAQKEGGKARAPGRKRGQQTVIVES